MRPTALDRRIEMLLRARSAQHVGIVGADMEIDLRHGETIRVLSRAA